MLISNYRERRARNHEKLRTLLNFLKENTYSDFKNLMLLFDFKNHKPLYLLLAKAIRMGLVQKHEIDTVTMKISLWGITNEGLAVVVTPHEDVFPERFEPSKVTERMLTQRLDNQRARLILEKKGAYDWINGDSSTFRSLYQVKNRPVGLITLPDGTVIAIETERRVKTQVSYQSIMLSHLLARTQKHWIYVFLVAQDSQRKRAIELQLRSVKYVIFDHRHIPLETRHRDMFRVYSFDELKRLDLEHYA